MRKPIVLVAAAVALLTAGNTWVQAAPLPIAGAWRLLDGPLASVYHAAVYDPVRDQMVVIGADGPYVLSLTVPETWSRIDAPGAQPLSGVRAVYDSVGDRALALSFDLDRLYVLALVGTPQWSTLPLSGGPGYRFDCAMDYDRSRNRLIVFGGRDQAQQDHNDVWALSLDAHPTWTQLGSVGAPPEPRSGSSCTYDPRRDRMILFGGVSDQGYFGDTWTFDLEHRTWGELPVIASADVPRAAHCAVYDPAGDRLLVNGGKTATDYGGSIVLELSLASTNSWSIHDANVLHVVNSSLILDPVRNRLVRFGGYHEEGTLSCTLRDVFQADLGNLTSWSRIAPHSFNVALDGMGVAYDSRRHGLVTLGGYTGCHDQYYGFCAELVLDQTTPSWTFIPGLTRAFHTMIYDSARDRLAEFGGTDYYGDSPDHVGTLDLSAPAGWQILNASGAPPPLGRPYASTHDAGRDRMWVWYQGPAIWYMQFGTDEWHHLDTAGEHPGRGALVVDPVTDDLLVRDYATGDLWRFDEPTSGWSRLVVSGTPPINGYTLVDSATHAVYVMSDHVSMLSLDDRQWRDLPTTGRWPTWTTAVVFEPTAHRFVVWGGAYQCEGVCDYSGVWELALDAPTGTMITRADGSWVEGGIRLRWETKLGLGTPVGIVRQAGPGPWRNVASAIPDERGTIEFEDRDVRAGIGYRYALSIDGGARFGEVPVVATSSLRLAITSPVPNPSSGPVRMMVTLPETAPASIELLDLQGRQVLRRAVSSAAGVHEIVLGSNPLLAPGFYVLRLTQRHASVIQRIVRVR